MSDIRFRNLDKLTTAKAGDTRTLSIKLPTSDSGKIMQRCPQEGCQPALFQLGNAPEQREIEEGNMEVIRRTPGTNGVTCPYCGTDGDDEDFITEEDKEHAVKVMEHAVLEDLSEFLGGMSKDFNRQIRSSRNSMFSVNMEVKSSPNPRPYAYREDLLRGIACHVCSREYGVYALALFCPDCGAPNVSTHFDREIDIINQQIEISKQIDSDENREISYRLLANAHEDSLTALETALRAVHRYIVINKFPDKIVELEKLGNAFQNIEKAEKKFRELNIELLEGLSKAEKEALEKAIQKRHVIGHNLGLADEKYIRVAGDAKVGRNVPVLAQEIEEFTNLCARLIHSIERGLVYVA